MDVTTWSGEKVNDIIERLDINRYITRDGLSAEKLWSFSLTKKGAASLPPDDYDEASKFLGLIPKDFVILDAIKDGGKCRPGNIINSFVSDIDEKRDYAISVIKLIRHGYIKESGFIRRDIAITQEGKEILGKYEQMNKAG